ncbi:MAG: hypothetical protein U9N82_04110 [Thermodesulfobacteriota bacterium]|nr:hypothetical protein [Thermodesulfobacteriota bacterium]
MKDKTANRPPDSPVRLALHGRRAGVAKHCGQMAGRLRKGGTEVRGRRGTLNRPVDL